MDDFGETDAAAEFLAREKETLGEMEAEIIADNGKYFSVFFSYQELHFYLALLYSL